MSNAIDRLLAQREALDARIDQILERPAEPEPDVDGCAVVWFRVRFREGSGCATYTYAAVLAKGSWWLTGRDTLGRTWQGMLDYLEVERRADIIEMWVASEWQQLR